MPKNASPLGNESQQSDRAGSLNRDLSVRQSITRAIRNSFKSREQVAAEMSCLLGCRITAHMLNDWTAESKGAHRFPASFVPAFCQACGNDELQRVLFGPEHLAMVDLAERMIQADKLETEIKLIRGRVRREV